MKHRLPSLTTMALACGGVLMLLGVTAPASAQVYSCPPGYYLASDYRCYMQGYAVAPPAQPYVYYPPYAYYYQQPYYYPRFALRFGFGGHRDFDHDDRDHGDRHHH